MKVIVAGANGKVGTILCGKLWAHSYFSPVALIRDERQQMKFTALGVPSVVGDLEAGVALTGEVAGRIESVKPVAQIIAEMARDYFETVERLAKQASD